MVSLNRVLLAGNTTRDPELRYTPSGRPVTDVGLAVNTRRNGRDGESVDEALFMEVVLWDHQAEFAAEHVRKGALVLVEGRLTFHEWEKDGVKRNKVKVTAERLQVLGDRPAL